ncbi:FAD-dependent oxidoreductase [Halorubrum sp. JWXQ-INN 858]|uniref:NAD(P)/FAD-dependent oxidoreductase n=1 Tax=Halorubrum sp. JWXQ-INN 858 TaxID=2690782 RepID=UPI001359529D|nr:FAD-dependent oxidoreductase [Halorubrum sp. JWXQ-INN 858]MWV65125.1 FAD-dependent oxidoreductase [Halorubrum sp. JWXQ-INN 858]
MSRTTEPRAGGPTVAVVGGGAVGVTAAADLAARDAAVTLFERGDLGDGSSGRAAGVLYDAYAEDVDAALAARAMERFRELSGSLPGFEFTPCPYVIAVRDGDDDAEAVPAMVDRMRAHGRDVSVVDPEALGERFPLATDDLAVAAVAEGAGWADPGSYVSAMADRAREAGVTIETGVEVELAEGGEGGDGGEVEEGGDGGDGGEGGNDTLEPTLRVDGTPRRFDAVVVAVGAHTERFFSTAEVRLPVKPYRVQALVSDAAYDGPMTYDATAGVYFRPHPAGLLAGDGTVPVEADPDDYDRDGDDWFVEDVSVTLRERARHDPAVDRAWAGLCTATPDGDPLVGPVADGVFVAAGWQGHGFMRAPAFGEHLATGVLATLSPDDGEIEDGDGNASESEDANGNVSENEDGNENADAESPWIDAFDPTRFDGDESFEIREGMTVRSRGD